MASEQGRYTIGLTGNIATGKSVVRRMLEHLGAYTIDADGLSHRAMGKGAPGHQPLVDTFGQWILDSGGEIDRKKLGDLVFRDPDALRRLEAIVHPLVRAAVDILMRRSTQRVVVVEAIKLLEGDLRDRCDSIWVTYAPPALQAARLMASRQLSAEQAQQRILAQSSQTSKLSQADVVIRNEGSFDDLWHQVEHAWKQHVPFEAPSLAGPATASLDGTLSVKRGKPQDAAAIAEFLNRVGRPGSRLTADDIMAQFGEKAYMLLHLDRRLVGIAGWQVENLVVRTSDLYLEPGVDVDKALSMLMQAIEAVSADLQCEASLAFPRMQLASETNLWQRLGYQPRTPEELAVEAWTDAARESMPSDTILLFKQMRQDRILRPI